MSELQTVFINETIELSKNIQVSFLELGKRLLKIRDEELYLGQYDSFPEFLEETKMSEGNASKLINIYQTFIEKYQIPEEKVLVAGVGKLGEVLKYAKDEDTSLRIVELAKVLPTKELKRTLKEESGEIPENCEHSEMYSLTICKKCGIKL